MAGAIATAILWQTPHYFRNRFRGPLLMSCATIGFLARPASGLAGGCRALAVIISVLVCPFSVTAVGNLLIYSP